MALLLYRLGKFSYRRRWPVLLTSGMRESYMHGESARHAVRSGFSHLERILPDVDVEGAKLRQDATSAPASTELVHHA